MFKLSTVTDGGDNIVISSNEELEIALDDMAETLTVNKLYVILQFEKNLPDMTKAGKCLHPGIICDVCDKNIYGFRFKCMQCSDYDLCTECIALGYHPEHYMVRMTEPLELSSYDIRRLAHHMRKFTGAMKKASGSSHGKDDETRRCPYRSSGKRSSCPAFSAASGKVHFDPSVINSLANLVKSVCVLFEEPCQEQKKSRNQRRDPSTEAATEATEDSQQEATRHSFTQLLKIFEDNISNISQFLDPLGINVVVTADNDDDSAKNDKPTADKAQTEANDNAPSTSETAKKFPGEGKRLCDDSTTEKATVNDEASSTPPKKATSPKRMIEEDDWSEIEDLPQSLSNHSSVNGTTPKEVTL